MRAKLAVDHDAKMTASGDRVQKRFLGFMQGVEDEVTLIWWPGSDTQRLGGLRLETDGTAASTEHRHCGGMMRQIPKYLFGSAHTRGLAVLWTNLFMIK